MNAIKIINIILLGVVIILLFNSIHPLKTLTGNSILNLNTSNPQCYFYNLDEKHQIPNDACCFEIEKQLKCESINKTDLKCYTSKKRYYIINHPMLNYCKKEGYNVR
jgi:hypothetical protein